MSYFQKKHIVVFPTAIPPPTVTQSSPTMTPKRRRNDNNDNNNNNKKNKKPIPLAPPPAMRSRKKARIVTTLFHKYTRERDLAEGDPTKVQEINQKIQEIGGREAYQRASQLSTTFHSTSKWVVGYLSRNGWLYGMKNNTETNDRRQTMLLEVGAINTELLDTAKQMKRVQQKNNDDDMTFHDTPKYKINVQAIDLKSSQTGIEEADFNLFPLKHSDPSQRYDVIVCSMVINCVTTPEQRGLMLTRLYHQLCPGGLCFFTLPRLCLMQSPFTSQSQFEHLLQDGVGFEIEKTKHSPKVAFYVLKRPRHNATKEKLDPKWTMVHKINSGKKFRNTFAIILNEDQVMGTSLH